MPFFSLHVPFHDPRFLFKGELQGSSGAISFLLIGPAAGYSKKHNLI